MKNRDICSMKRKKLAESSKDRYYAGMIQQDKREGVKERAKWAFEHMPYERRVNDLKSKGTEKTDE